MIAPRDWAIPVLVACLAVAMLFLGIIVGHRTAHPRPTYEKAASVCLTLVGSQYDDCVDTVADQVAAGIVAAP